MMGRLKSEQSQLFYQFNLEDAVPHDHLVRRIDAALDLTWLRSELASHRRRAAHARSRISAQRPTSAAYHRASGVLTSA